MIDMPQCINDIDTSRSMHRQDSSRGFDGHNSRLLDESVSTLVGVHLPMMSLTSNPSQLVSKAKRRGAKTCKRDVTVAIRLIGICLTLQHCIAFPQPQKFDRSHVEFNRKPSSRLAYSSRSIVGELDIHVAQTPTSNSIGKHVSTGFFSHLFRRRTRQKLVQSTKNIDQDLASAKVTPTLNRLWRMTVRGIREKPSINESAVGQFDDSVAHRHKPISHFKQTNLFRRQRLIPNVLTSNKMLQISKVQSFASSSTALNMVLSTPESIIEQVSTEKLLDILIDESVRTSSREPIMMQFNPRRGWIWRQWRGTVFSETWKSGLLNMALATFVVFLYKMYPNLKDLLQGFSILWGQLLSVTTFTLTFFLNQSYGLWRKCYDYSRRLQGRLNDLGMTLAAHAKRVQPSSPDIPATYTPQSKQALDLVSRYVRVFNLLTYASFTRSHRPILTPRGMRRLVERGILTPKEREILTDAEIPATQRHNAVLVWLIRLFLEGRQTGIFEGGYGFEEQFMEKCHVIRAQYGAIGDELQGRMPLAYAHIVQVLLDVVLWMYPFMALSTGMAWYIGVVGTGLLTMFYQGLFDLAKQFLDPYDNENYGKGEDPLVIDTLIAETNAGSVRWLNSFQQQPWSKQLLKDGEMYDSMLPVRGYSVEELMERKAQEEAEQAERERQIQEKKSKEEKLERERAEKWLKENFESYKQNGTISLVDRSNGTAILSTRAQRAMSSNFENKTLLEVSGGVVVSKTSLVSSNPRIDAISTAATNTTDDTDPLNSTDENALLKILTLDDGTLVTLDDSIIMNSTELIDEAPDQITADEDFQEITDTRETTSTLLPWNKIGDRTPSFNQSTYGVGDYLQTLSKSPYQDENEEVEEDFDDEEYGPLKIEWWDESEMRLSQMLADEDWSYLNEDELQNTTMDYEEFQRRANDLIERTESEIAETKEILYSSPGSQADYDAKERSSSPVLTNRMISLEENEPAYDQTKLDAISQLWGAPPDVLGKTMLKEEKDQKTINEDTDFANIYALWGQPIESEVPTEADDVIAPPIDGIRQLWNDKIIADLAPVDHDSELETNPLFSGLEWWDTISEDGKEIRLSMMLADEEYEEENQEEQDREPMSYEQFALETENMIQMVEDERKETEAILAAPPGADAPAELDETEETFDQSSDSTSTELDDMVASSKEFNEMVNSLSQPNNADSDNELESDFSVLEMDIEDNLGSDDASRYRNATKQTASTAEINETTVDSNEE